MPDGRPSARYWPRGSRRQRSARSVTNSSGLVKTRGSRLAAAAEQKTRPPVGIKRPNRSTSRRAKREALSTGDEWRSISNQANFTRRSSARTASSCSGWVRSRNHMLARPPWSVSWSASRIVATTSAAFGGPSARSRWAMVLIMSSPGSVRRFASKGSMYRLSSSRAASPSRRLVSSQPNPRCMRQYQAENGARSSEGRSSIAPHNSRGSLAANEEAMSGAWAKPPMTRAMASSSPVWRRA